MLLRSLAAMRALSSGPRPALASIAHDEELPLTGHLEELRTRLIVSLVVLGVAFGLCFWQNHRLLSLMDAPLAHQTQQQVRQGHGPLGNTYVVARGARDVALQLRSVVGLLAAEHHRPPAFAATLARIDGQLQRDAKGLTIPATGNRPITLGIGEPFTTTLTVSLIFALTIALPLLVWQLYAFMIPAVDPAQRRSMRPLATAIPVLFVTGMAFGYYVVLPAAVHFFQNFNSGQFNVLVQASQYYRFAATTLLAMGLMFQVPVAILLITRIGIITPGRLRRSRRYAVGACALVAAALPGDAITMLLETVPLYLLFEGSVLLASLIERRAQARARSARPVAAGSYPE